MTVIIILRWTVIDNFNTMESVPHPTPEDAMPPKTDQKLNLLYRLSQVVGSDLGLSDVLKVIVGTTVDLMQCKIVTILLFDEE